MERWVVPGLVLLLALAVPLLGVSLPQPGRLDSYVMVVAAVALVVVRIARSRR